MQIFSQCSPMAATPWLVSYAPVFSAGTVAVVGLVTGYIALQQWLTARAKLRLDLYDRRWRIYEACTLLVQAVPLANPQQHDQAFYEAKTSATFLFDARVVEYMNILPASVAEQSRRMHRNQEVATPDDLSWFFDGVRWEVDKLSEIQALFAPYLRFETVRDGFYRLPKIGLLKRAPRR